MNQPQHVSMILGRVLKQAKRNLEAVNQLRTLASKLGSEECMLCGVWSSPAKMSDSLCSDCWDDEHMDY